MYNCTEQPFNPSTSEELRFTQFTSCANPVPEQPLSANSASKQPPFNFSASPVPEQPQFMPSAIPTNVSMSQCGHVASGFNVVSTNQVCQFSPPPSTPNVPIQCGPRVVITLPFELKFLTPAIKICAGCRKGYPRAPDGKSCLPAPKDLCLVHKEQHMYYNVVNCKQQLSSLTNVHYHANSSCPKARFPDFNPRAVQIPDNIKVKLQLDHRIYLFQTFEITI